MKKTSVIILTVMLCLMTGPGFSQSGLPVKLGLKVAPNIGWMSPGTNGYSNDGIRLGGTIGFMSDIYFAKNYAFTTGLNFQFINGMLNYADSVLVAENNHYVVKDGEVFRKYNFLYIEIPMLVKMSTKTFGRMSYFGQIGFGTGFRLRATVDEHFIPDEGNPVDQQYDLNNETTLIRESIQIGLGCEFHLDESSRILVGITYSNSLNNVLTGVNYKSNLVEKSQLNFAELNIGFIF